jgi:hypothetical protein
MYSFWPNISTVFFVKKLHSLNSGSKTYWEAFVYFKCCLRPAANRKSLNSILVCYSRLDTYPIKTWVTTSEYCMIYKGPGFLAVARFGSSPTPSPPPLISLLSVSDTQEDWERESTCWWKRGWGRSQIIRRRESLVLYKKIIQYSMVVTMQLWFP